MLDATYFQLPDTSYDYNARPYECDDSPCDLYAKYVDEVIRYDEFTKPMEKTGLALYDGVKDYSDSSNSEMNAILNLRDFLLNNLNALDKEIETCANKEAKLYFELVANKYRQEMKVFDSQLSDFKRNVAFVNEEFKKANQKESIHRAIRNTYCINIDNLKKIEGYDALNRIFKYLDKVSPKELPRLRESYSSIFDENIRIFIRISIIYDFLNLIGYFPDESLNKENKYLRSGLDRHHAMLGCFCDIFVTRDKRFIKKIKVIYEYFNLSTKIYNIEVLENSTSFKVLFDLTESVI